MYVFATPIRATLNLSCPTVRRYMLSCTKSYLDLSLVNDTQRHLVAYTQLTA
jgi:hypothetical protein